MDIGKFKAAGFLETKYRGRDGVFWTKRMPISEMPYAMKHIVEGEWVTETEIAVIEIEYGPGSLFSDGGVKMILDNYMEAAVSITSKEGLVILRDAGVDC